MTSEVALMNLNGVSLGADSVVSLSRAWGGRTTQPTFQKISIINAAAPVAAMINDSAYFAGLPWPLVFERFAVHCGEAPLTFDAYRDRLVAFLADFDGLSGLASIADSDIESFRNYVLGVVSAYRQKVAQLSRNFEAAFGEGLAAAALEQLREDVLFIPAEGESDEDEATVPTERSRIEPTPQLIEFVEKHLPDTLEVALAWVFDGIEVPEAMVPALAELVAQSILVDWLPEYASNTQLILAGFGAGAITPSLIAMEVGGAFAGRLKYLITDRVDTSATRESFVKTFAQAQLGTAMITGARPAFESLTLRENRDELLDLVFKALSRARLSERQANGLAKDILLDSQAALRRSLERAKARHTSIFQAKFAPILETADVDTMARLARKFVEITVLEHELLRADGVGRPIRVVTLTRNGVRTDIDGVTQ